MFPARAGMNWIQLAAGRDRRGKIEAGSVVVNCCTNGAGPAEARGGGAWRIWEIDMVEILRIKGKLLLWIYGEREEGAP
jgi:hypothetical protein